MYKYILRRLLMLIPVVVGISFLVFSIISLTPGDPARLILGEKASTVEIEKLNEELGLNDPFMVRYVNYMKAAIRGDLGKSYRSTLPVIEEIASRFPTTLKLAFFSMIITIFVAIPIGIISAVKQYTLADTLSVVIALFLTSMPSFWLGLMLILIVSLGIGILPATGSETLAHFILPSITLAAGSIAVIIRMTRSTMLEVIRQDYIRTAKAKGADEVRIILKHSLRNAMIPVVTAIGINFGYLLGGTVLIESVFSMSGVGMLLVGAIRMKDVPVVLGAVILLAIAFSLINLIIDISYGFIDPRISAQYKS
ncbi:ABC transporter permease [Acidaminobacter sp. JC074]|uniref:ABC transporter permease n=1 Tax=Acidaminobacter sp. JC074 TaxID=2530199 RepID=UPI001F0F97A2|nr:ABC transporter permease [Acidaminobacter sp. JC074]